MCILGYLCTTFSSNFSFLQSFTIWPINNHKYEALRNRTPLCRIKHAIFRQIIFLLLSATVLYWQGKFSTLEEWWQDDRGVSVCYKLAGFNTAQKSNHLCIVSLSEQYNWEPTQTTKQMNCCNVFEQDFVQIIKNLRWWKQGNIISWYSWIKDSVNWWHVIAVHTEQKRNS